MWATVTGISVVSSTLFSVLELFVAFLQAYIFTFLSALFIGAVRPPALGLSRPGGRHPPSAAQSITSVFRFLTRPGHPSGPSICKEFQLA